MKKFGFGVLWFLVSIGCFLLGGIVVGFMADTPALGVAASRAYGREYSGIVILVSLIIAVIGSIKGWFPGTKASNGLTRTTP